MAENRYYWIKLHDDFFSSKRIKKLRTLAGGDTLTIIYLKMQLLSIKTNGVLTYTGLEDSFAKELALDLDESPGDVELLLVYLTNCGLIETSDNINWLLPYAVECTGTEGSSAKRVREFREREKQKALHCNADVTDVTLLRYGEKEIEKEIEKEKDNTLFDEFWSHYPKKVGKKDAEKAFNKIKPSKSLVEQMISVVEKAKKTEQWTKQGGQFIPNPSTWLNQGRWEDDINTYQVKTSSEGRVIDDDRFASVNF